MKSLLVVKNCGRAWHTGQVSESMVSPCHLKPPSLCSVRSFFFFSEKHICVSEYLTVELNIQFLSFYEKIIINLLSGQTLEVVEEKAHATVIRAA